MRDLPLYLPEGKYMESLLITAEYPIIDEVIQRAVVILTMRRDDDLLINGLTLGELLPQATTAGIESLLSSIVSISSTLKAMLNEDETVVSDVAFRADLEENSNKFILNIDITKESGDTVSAVIYTNE